jgi:hypothetical protein
MTGFVRIPKTREGNAARKAISKISKIAPITAIKKGTAISTKAIGRPERIPPRRLIARIISKIA